MQRNSQPLQRATPSRLSRMLLLVIGLDGERVRGEERSIESNLSCCCVVACRSSPPLALPAASRSVLPAAMSTDYYLVLGVDRSADVKIIKKAYRKLALEWRQNTAQRQRRQTHAKRHSLSALVSPVVVVCCQIRTR